MLRIPQAALSLRSCCKGNAWASSSVGGRRIRSRDPMACTKSPADIQVHQAQHAAISDPLVRNAEFTNLSALILASLSGQRFLAATLLTWRGQVPLIPALTPDPRIRNSRRPSRGDLASLFVGVPPQRGASLRPAGRAVIWAGERGLMTLPVVPPGTRWGPVGELISQSDWGEVDGVRKTGT